MHIVQILIKQCDLFLSFVYRRSILLAWAGITENHGPSIIFILADNFDTLVDLLKAIHITCKRSYILIIYSQLGFQINTKVWISEEVMLLTYVYCHFRQNLIMLAWHKDSSYLNCQLDITKLHVIHSVHIFCQAMTLTLTFILIITIQRTWYTAAMLSLYYASKCHNLSLDFLAACSLLCSVRIRATISTFAICVQINVYIKHDFIVIPGTFTYTRCTTSVCSYCLWELALYSSPKLRTLHSLWCVLITYREWTR